MKWTDQQLAIFDWFRQSQGHLVVKALAGSAKTTTILEGIRHAPEPTTVICAFNTDIAKELTAKLAARPVAKNRVVEAKTLHGLGLRVVGHHWRGVEINRKRSEELAKAAFAARGRKPFYKGIKALISTMVMVKDTSPLKTDVSDIIRVGLAHDLFEKTDRRFDIQTQAELIHWMIEESKKRSAVIDFCDMVWLPVVMGWEFPSRYKLVVIDELQDLSFSQILLAKKLSVGRISGVGDPKQAIYGWRGADSLSIDRMQQELSAVSLPLTTTFRCSQAVVREAQRLVPAFTAMDDAPEGGVSTVDYATLLSMVAPGDFVLSRVNAPLATLCLRLQREGISARISGRDVYEEAKELFDRFKSAPTVEAFATELMKWLASEVKAAEKDGSPFREERARDRSEMLSVLCKEAKTVPEILSLLKKVFAPGAEETDDSVVCSTIHKAKGLERDRVFILKETLSQYNPRYAKNKLFSPEEYNVEYVAITRARRELIWVTGSAASTLAAPPILLAGDSEFDPIEAG